MLADLLSSGTAKKSTSLNASPVTVTLFSGDGSINAGNSGVLAGGDLSVNAPNGGVTGLFVTTGNAVIHGSENVSVTVLAGGTANVSGQSVSGEVVGGGDVTVSGSEVTATAISTGGSASGGASSGGALAVLLRPLRHRPSKAPTRPWPTKPWRKTTTMMKRKNGLPTKAPPYAPRWPRHRDFTKS